MGCLDHSTNNIIVDAVLTDIGREFLSRNDNYFNIVQFALGDDEIDYSIIQKYGRTVGKEKIEKNTPVFEAFSKASLGLKYKASSVADPFITHFPVVTISNLTDDIMYMYINDIKNRQSSLDLKISNTENTTIPDDIADFDVKIELDRRFLRLIGPTPDIVDANNTAQYTVSTSRNAQGNFDIKQTLSLERITDTTFKTYSISSGAYVRTFVKITGFSSGVTKTVEVRISK
jgi:hypothetical protein